METKDKKFACRDFAKMIKQSWTFQKLTSEEKARCLDAIYYFPDEQNALCGTYKQRWMQLHMVYNAFLAGVGYTGFDWRENDV